MTHYQKIMMAVGLAGVVLLGLLVVSIYHPQKAAPVMDDSAQNKEKAEASSDQNLKEVVFCDKTYKLDGDNLIIDGVNVVERIAQVATKNQEDYVCNNIQTNEPGEVLHVKVTTDPNGKYYSVDIRSFFKVIGNKIYSVGGLDGKETFYANIK